MRDAIWIRSIIDVRMGQSFYKLKHVFLWSFSVLVFDQWEFSFELIIVGKTGRKGNVFWWDIGLYTLYHFLEFTWNIRKRITGYWVSMRYQDIIKSVSLSSKELK